MAEPDRTKYLRIALLLVGLIFIIGIYPLTIIWPSGWSWHTGGHSDYLQMILGIYATLGVFLVVGSRNPLSNLSLIWSTGVVKHCAWCDHGGAIGREPRTPGTPLGRRNGLVPCGGHPGDSDTARRGSESFLAWKSPKPSRENLRRRREESTRVCGGVRNESRSRVLESIATDNAAAKGGIMGEETER